MTLFWSYQQAKDTGEILLIPRFRFPGDYRRTGRCGNAYRQSEMNKTCPWLDSQKWKDLVRRFHTVVDKSLTFADANPTKIRVPEEEDELAGKRWER